MLHVENGHVEIRGTRLDLMLELAVLIRRLMKVGAVDREDVEKLVGVAFLSEEDLKKETDKVTEEMSEKLLSDLLAGGGIENTRDFLNELFKGRK